MHDGPTTQVSALHPEIVLFHEVLEGLVDRDPVQVEGVRGGTVDVPGNGHRLSVNAEPWSAGILPASRLLPDLLGRQQSISRQDAGAPSLSIVASAV